MATMFSSVLGESKFETADTTSVSVSSFSGYNWSVNAYMTYDSANHFSGGAFENFRAGGTTAYCIDIGQSVHSERPRNIYNLTSILSQSRIDYLAAGFAYIDDHYSGNERTVYRQCFIWEKITDWGTVGATGGTSSFSWQQKPTSNYNSVLSDIESFANSNSSKYEGYGNLYTTGSPSDIGGINSGNSGQPMISLNYSKKVGKLKLVKQS